MWYRETTEYYSAINKNETISSAATWIQLEIIILSKFKSERERQIPYAITYMYNLKYDTNEPTYKVETDSQTQRTDLWLSRGKETGEGWARS